MSAKIHGTHSDQIFPVRLKRKHITRRSRSTDLRNCRKGGEKERLSSSPRGRLVSMNRRSWTSHSAACTWTLSAEVAGEWRHSPANLMSLRRKPVSLVSAVYPAYLTRYVAYVKLLMRHSFHSSQRQTTLERLSHGRWNPLPASLARVINWKKKGADIRGTEISDSLWGSVIHFVVVALFALSCSLELSVFRGLVNWLVST